MDPAEQGWSAMLNSSLRADDLLDLARRCNKLWGRPETALFPEVERRISLLAEREGALADCLLVVLLGGTKVGKTSLVNALAGREIGQASARACFTTRPALYVHESREAQARSRLSGILLPDDRYELHHEAALERIILVDAPDIDGIETTHHAVFDQLLERADLAICVVTTQKYDSAALYRILGEKVGFRRTVFVFNRIDEGIPFSQTVREDFLRKIGGFALRPPAGEELPVFAVSALHALQAKQGAPTGPKGDFPALEALLRERLDQALVRRISEENLQALEQETGAFVTRACQIEEARQAILEIGTVIEATTQETIQGISSDLEEMWRDLSGALEGRRWSLAATSVGGPFGAYLQVALAIRAMTNGFSPGMFTPERAVSTLLRQARDRVTQASAVLSPRIEELLDRHGLDPQPLLRRMDSAPSVEMPAFEDISGIVREQIGAHPANRATSILLNLGPVIILLLLVRYFVLCLLSAHEPGAGMFIGGGIVFWLVCYLQTAFWLPKQAGSIRSPATAILEKLSGVTRTRLESVFRNWKAEFDPKNRS